MVNGLHLYSAFIQSAVQCMPLIHPFTHQRRLAAMQGTNQLVRSNRGLGVLLRDTSTRPGWDRTGNPPTARRKLYLLSHKVGDLYTVKGILNKEGYHSILQCHAIPCGQRLIGANFLLQQYNDPKHTNYARTI